MLIRQSILLISMLMSYSFVSTEFVYTANAQENSPPWTVFPVHYSLAEEVSKVISELYEAVDENDRPRVVADSRTNVLFVTGSNEAVQNIRELLKLLDKNVPRTMEFVDQIKIFSLEHEDAGMASQIVSEMMGPEVKIVTDERTNSLIVNGTDIDLSFVEAILLKLDQVDSRAEILETYPLKNVPADSVVQTLNDLQVEARIAVDSNKNQLLVLSNDVVHHQIEEIIKMLDAPKEQPLNRQLLVRLVWLVDAKLLGENASDPAESLARTLEIIQGKLDVKNLKTAAQMIVSIDPDGEASIFDSTGTAQFADGALVNLQITGMIKGQKANSSVIELEINATRESQRNRSDPRSPVLPRNVDELVSMKTKVVAPDGHSIVLGVSSIQSAPSVFILQVLPTVESKE